MIRNNVQNIPKGNVTGPIRSEHVHVVCDGHEIISQRKIGVCLDRNMLLAAVTEWCRKNKRLAANEIITDWSINFAPGIESKYEFVVGGKEGQ